MDPLLALLLAEVVGLRLVVAPRERVRVEGSPERALGAALSAARDFIVRAAGWDAAGLVASEVGGALTSLFRVLLDGGRDGVVASVLMGSGEPVPELVGERLWLGRVVRAERVPGAPLIIVEIEEPWGARTRAFMLAPEKAVELSRCLTHLPLQTLGRALADALEGEGRWQWVGDPRAARGWVEVVESLLDALGVERPGPDVGGALADVERALEGWRGRVEALREELLPRVEWRLAEVAEGAGGSPERLARGMLGVAALLNEAAPGLDGRARVEVWPVLAARIARAAGARDAELVRELVRGVSRAAGSGSELAKLWPVAVPPASLLAGRAKRRGAEGVRDLGLAYLNLARLWMEEAPLPRPDARELAEIVARARAVGEAAGALEVLFS